MKKTGKNLYMILKFVCPANYYRRLNPAWIMDMCTDVVLIIN